MSTSSPCRTSPERRHGRFALAFVALLAGASLGGCGEKAGAAPDGGDGPVRIRGGTTSRLEGGAGEPIDSGVVVDDLAIPQTASEDLSTRMRHLLEAIVQDNPDLAGDVVFPREAYVLTRDAADPQSAWDKKVSSTFRRSVERTHKRTKGIEQAKFVSFELGHAVVQLTPKKNGFKKPLWSVKHSKLTFAIDGKTRHLDIAELTGWRGAWYVTRLR